MTRYITDFDPLYRYSTASVPITGTGMQLSYNCRRTLGRAAARQLEVPLIGDEVPDWLNGIDVSVEVAGQVDQASYDDPSPNLVHEFTWDGRTGSGYPTHGAHPVDIDVDYRWQGSYGVPEEEVKSFAQNSDATYQEIQSRATGSTPVGADGRSEDLFLTVIDYRREGLGGWSLTSNHRYDSNQGILYRGDGTSRTVRTSFLKPTISVVAGKDPDERLNNPAGVTLGADESVYVADYNSPAVRKFEQNGGSTTLAGGFGGGGGDVRQTRATNAQLFSPVCAREGPEGSVYVTDSDRHIVRRIDPDGTVELVAGRPDDPGFESEQVATRTANLSSPTGLAFDDDGALLVAEGDNDVVRRIETGTDGETRIVAGTGESGYDGDGGPATDAKLSRPSWIATGPNGGVYVADSNNNAIRRFEVGGDIETVVGGNGSGSAGEGDGGPATDAKLSNPLGVDVTDDGEIYVACSGTHTVRRVAPDGTIETLAGGNGSGYTGNGGPATDAKLHNPSGVVAAEDGSVYVSEWRNHVVRRVAPDGTIDVFNGWLPEDERTGATERPLIDQQQGGGVIRLVEVGPKGTIYYSGFFGGGPGIRKVTTDGSIEPVAGENGREYTGDGGPATDASFQRIDDLHAHDDGSLYVVDGVSSVVRKIDTDGTITTVAGTGEQSVDGVHGDGGPATDAKLSFPLSVTVSPGGELYIAESGHRVVRRVDASGTITTHLDDSTPLGGKVSGLGRLPDPTMVALDENENLYVGFSSSRYGYLVLTELSDGTLRYVTAQYDPDEFDESSRRGQQRFPSPNDVDVAPDGTVFLVSQNDAYRATTTDSISKIAGVGYPSVVGDEGPAQRAGLMYPFALGFGPAGQLYISESVTNVIRRIDVRLTGEAKTVVPDREGTEFYEFDTSGYHTRTYDAETGEVVRTFSYDEDGLITSVTDIDGETTTIERDDDGNPTAIVAPNGQRTALTVDTNGYLERVENPAGYTTSLSYVDDGLLSKYEAPGGRSVEFGYDDVGKLDSVTTAAGTTTLSESESDSGTTRTVTEQTPLGRTKTWEVDHSDGHTLTTEYPSGAVSVFTDHEDGAKNRTYRSGEEIDQDPHMPDPRFGEAAAFPGLERRSTPNGLEATKEVKRSARMGTDADPRSVERVVENQIVNGRTYKYVFDTAAKEHTTTTPEGRSETVETDAARRHKVIDHDGLAPMTHSYDDTGRVESTTWGTGSNAREYTLSYDADGGFLESITNPAGDTLSFTRNDAEYVEETTLPDGRTIGYDLTEEGLLSTVTAPGGTQYEFAYDEAGTLDSVTLTDGSTIDYEIDADGAVSSVTYPDGATLSHSYDGAGRTEEIGLGHGSITFTWDDATDLPSSVDSPDGVSLAFEFDGSLVKKRTWSGPVSGVVERSYDDAFRLDSRTVVGNTVTFDYDDDDRRTAAGDLDIVRNDDTGLVDETTLASTTETWTQTEFGTVDTHTATAAGTTLYDADYTYDDRGLVTELEETVDGTTTTREFEYDENARIERVITDGTTTQEFGYDDDNNRDSHTRGGATVSASYDDRNRLESYGDRSYEYDDAGRLERVTENGSATTYDYDVRHNLRSVTKPDGTTIEYLYDGFDRRVAKRVDGTVTRKWLYRDGLNPVAELDGDDNLVAQFVYGTRDYVPDYVIKNGTTYSIVTDHLGSPRLVVDANSGAIEQRIDYDVFGRVTRDTNPGFQPFGFAGGLYDPDTDLVSHGARDYDPHTGRWTTPDPMQIAGGSFNRYTYAGNAPQNLVDRTGLAVVSGTAILVGMATGAAVGAAFDAGMQAATKGVNNIDYRQTAVAGTVGAVTGGAGGAISSAGYSSAATAIGLGAAGSASEHVGKQYVKGECVTWSGTAKAATVGGITGGAAGTAGNKLDDVAEDVGNKIDNYSDELGDAGDAALSHRMKPGLIEHGGGMAADATGKLAGAGLNAATSSPNGASK